MEMYIYAGIGGAEAVVNNVNTDQLLFMLDRTRERTEISPMI